LVFSELVFIQGLDFGWLVNLLIFGFGDSYDETDWGFE